MSETNVVDLKLVPANEARSNGGKNKGWLLRFTKHAMQRFQQRIRSGENYSPYAEMQGCVLSASPKELRKALSGRPQNLALGCCTMVCKDGAVLTVLRSNKANWSNPNPDRTIAKIKVPPAPCAYREHVKDWRRHNYQQATE